jgi:hypothetical protein
MTDKENHVIDPSANHVNFANQYKANLAHANQATQRL